MHEINKYRRYFKLCGGYFKMIPKCFETIVNISFPYIRHTQLNLLKDGEVVSSISYRISYIDHNVHINYHSGKLPYLSNIRNSINTVKSFWDFFKSVISRKEDCYAPEPISNLYAKRLLGDYFKDWIASRGLKIAPNDAELIESSKQSSIKSNTIHQMVFARNIESVISFMSDFKDLQASQSSGLEPIVEASN